MDGINIYKPALTFVYPLKKLSEEEFYQMVNTTYARIYTGDGELYGNYYEFKEDLYIHREDYIMYVTLLGRLFYE